MGNNNLWREYQSAIEASNLALALTLARRGVELKKAEGDLRHAGIWQRAVSNVLYLQGDYTDAAREARLGAKMQPDPYERSLSYIALGQMETHAGRYKSAFKQFDRAVELGKSYKSDLYLWTHLFGNRAVAFFKQGKTDRGMIDWEGAAYLLKQADYPSRAALYINNIGFQLIMCRQYEQAEQRLLEALELLEDDPHPHTDGLICDSLGYLYTLMRDNLNAERFLRRSAKTFSKLGDNQQLIGTLIHFSEFYARTRHYETAREEALRAITLAVEIKSDSLLGEAREQLKQVARSQMEETFADLFAIHQRNCSLVRRVIQRRRRNQSPHPDR